LEGAKGGEEMGEECVGEGTSRGRGEEKEN